tara:strand:+ start:804 stop:1130 length:327 start_codon:yes stop_codon:yes gene_type:complete
MSCKECKYFKIKEELGKSNKITKKPCCVEFKQYLSSLKICKRFIHKNKVDKGMVIFPSLLSILLILISSYFFFTEGIREYWILVIFLVFILGFNLSCAYVYFSQKRLF